LRQSNVIFGTLVFAFIVYITVRGQLPGYLNLFRGKSNDGLGGLFGAGDASSGAGSISLPPGFADTLSSDTSFSSPASL
jgi:hypothetical protein